MRSECTNYDHDNRYLTYDLGECLEPSNFSPTEASVDQEGTAVQIGIQRLPRLQGSNMYQCFFSSVEVSATVDASDSTQLTCSTPSKEDLGDLPENTGENLSQAL